MRKAALFGLVVLLAFGLLLAWAASQKEAWVESYAITRLQKALPSSRISIKETHLEWQTLLFKDVHIKEANRSFEADQITLHFTLKDLLSRRLGSVELSGGSLEIKGLTVKNIHMVLDPFKSGEISIGRADYQKLRVENLRSHLEVRSGLLIGPSLTGSVINGQITGRFELTLKDPYSYQIDLQLKGLSMPALITQFKFDEKVSLTGVFLGTIKARGDRSGLKEVTGDLYDSGQGGDLVILDKVFLQNIANRSHQPIELVEAGFKEYHFDTGRVGLVKKDRSLELTLDMNGDKGRRDLTTAFHDVF